MEFKAWDSSKECKEKIKLLINCYFVYSDISRVFISNGHYGMCSLTAEMVAIKSFLLFCLVIRNVHIHFKNWNSSLIPTVSVTGVGNSVPAGLGGIS